MRMLTLCVDMNIHIMMIIKELKNVSKLPLTWIFDAILLGGDLEIYVIDKKIMVKLPSILLRQLASILDAPFCIVI
jgi:hypothetical protein